MLIVGIPETDRVSFDISALRRKELTVKNVRRQNDCTSDAIELLQSGKLDLDPVPFRPRDLLDDVVKLVWGSEYLSMGMPLSLSAERACRECRQARSRRWHSPEASGAAPRGCAS